jgi:hypothetical protein
MASKTVVIVDADLPKGLALNAAFILGLSFGLRSDFELGPDVIDADCVGHAGITSVPIPILAADQDTLAAIRVAAAQSPNGALAIVDFSAVAQSSATYALYTERMAATHTLDAGYRAIALHGPRKAVKRLSGQLPLLR